MADLPLDDEGHLRLVLDYLGHELEPSILIGGWATFTRVGGDISRDIDQSELGAKLRLRVEVLAEHTEPMGQGDWRLLTIEAHLISKLAALLDRPDTEKGFKDAREVLGLLESGVDADVACRILAAASSAEPSDLPAHVRTAFDLLGPRSGANRAQRERIRRWQREWTSAITARIEASERGRPSLE